MPASGHQDDRVDFSDFHNRINALDGKVDGVAKDVTAIKLTLAKQAGIAEERSRAAEGVNARQLVMATLGSGAVVALVAKLLEHIH